MIEKLCYGLLKDADFVPQNIWNNLEFWSNNVNLKLLNEIRVNWSFGRLKNSSHPWNLTPSVRSYLFALMLSKSMIISQRTFNSMTRVERVVSWSPSFTCSCCWDNCCSWLVCCYCYWETCCCWESAMVKNRF